jgi:putative transposase
MNERLGELFDPKAEFGISEHFRPHWSQAGAIVFITFRTADSIPKEVLLRWEQEKGEWLRHHNLPTDDHWSRVVPTLEEKLRHAFAKQFNRCQEDFLDTCRGECVLKQSVLAKIVADSLMHFDGARYRMGDFVVMPNHVHLLASFGSEESMLTLCDSWMHYTAHQINMQLGRKGKFWQQEPFDHLVRSPEQYVYLKKYIKENGPKAGLNENQYLYRRYEG